MKTQALAMPDYVASLVTLQLTLIGLQSQVRDDAIFCPLMYENGNTLSLVTMCIAKRRWFRETPTLVLSIVELDDNTKIVQVYLRQVMPLPANEHDVQFLIRYDATVRALLVTHAKSSNMGRLTNLHRRGSR
jgi:hypothetical protein